MTTTIPGLACPVCSLEDVATHADHHECSTCGHEWPRDEEAAAEDAPRVVKDANGNVLADGDSVTLIKDLPVKGAGVTLKRGTTVKNIRLTFDEGEIECNHEKVRGLVLKTQFVKKA